MPHIWEKAAGHTGSGEGSRLGSTGRLSLGWCSWEQTS